MFKILSSPQVRGKYRSQDREQGLLKKGCGHNQTRCGLLAKSEILSLMLAARLQRAANAFPEDRAPRVKKLQSVSGLFFLVALLHISENIPGVVKPFGGLPLPGFVLNSLRVL